ncbi:MAG: metallophosphoesterase [Myxococcales bacterium]|nr:metallophosphoesterase [Myxococcales bacterium]
MRLAHCSDLHLLSLEGAGVLDFANKRWIGGLNLLTNRGRHHQSEIFEAMIEDLNQQEVDHILVTGDVTNLALEQEFRFARELFGRFSLSPEQITVIPGNHDAYVQKGAKHFGTHFQDFFSSDSAHASNETWPCIRRRGPVSILGLSTSLQTPWFTAYGVVGDEQLERLRTALCAPELEDTLRLVAIHHSPAEPRAHSRIRGLRDREKLYKLLEEVGAELILHGHEHLDLTASLPGATGDVPVRGIQSGTYDAGGGASHKRARYRIYEIADTCEAGKRPTMLGEELRLWDPAGKHFVQEETVRASGSVSASA